MKVRKFLFAGALIAASLFSVNSVMAQTNTDQVTVKIIFTPIQTIEVITKKTVEFEYSGIDVYNEGAKPQVLEKHLKVNSSGPFSVKATSTGFTGGLEDKIIPVGDIALLVKNSADNTLDSYTFVSTAQQLTAEGEVPLFTSTKGGKDLIFDVTYSNPGGLIKII